MISPTPASRYEQGQDCMITTLFDRQQYICGVDVLATRKDPVERLATRKVIAAFATASSDLGVFWIEYDLSGAGIEINDYDRAFIRRIAGLPTAQSSRDPDPHSGPGAAA